MTSKEAVKMLVEHVKVASYDDILNERPAMKFIGLQNGATRVIFEPFSLTLDDRPKIYLAIEMICSAMTVELGVFVSDSYMLKGSVSEGGLKDVPKGHMLHPDNWRPGVLQEVWEGNLPGKDMITENLVINVCDRSGDVAMAAVPYVREKNKIVWGGDDEVEIIVESEAGEDAPKLGGTFPDLLRHSMTRETLVDLMRKMGVAKEQFNLPDWEADIHQNCAIVRSMATEKVGWIVLVAHSQGEAEIIEESMRRDDNVECKVDGPMYIVFAAEEPEPEKVP